MARGDVVMVEFPEPAGKSGREQLGRRPAIAVQTDDAPGLPTLMVIPLTSQLSALRFPFTLRIEPSNQNGLTMPSALLVFQLRAIDRLRVSRTIGRLESRYLDGLDDLLRRLLRL